MTGNPLGPLLEAYATLLPAAQRPRWILHWRPVIAPLIAGEPDPSVVPLGIAFAAAPEQVAVGCAFSCVFQLLAWPDPACDRFTPGVEFGFLEGAVMVGRGRLVAVNDSESDRPAKTLAGSPSPPPGNRPWALRRPC